MYRPLGVDREGRAYVPLYISQALRTHVVVGHPVVASEGGKSLFIQVTPLNGPPLAEDGTLRWHVSVNNPTGETVTATLRRRIDLPGLQFEKREVTLEPGGRRILEHRAEGIPIDGS